MCVRARVILASILLLLKGSLKFRLIKDTESPREFARSEQFFKKEREKKESDKKGNG